MTYKEFMETPAWFIKTYEVYIKALNAAEASNK